MLLSEKVKMAVYIIDHFSQFLKIRYECDCNDLVVVAAGSADALSRSEAQLLKIFTEDELLNELLKITKKRNFLFKNFISNLANVGQFIPPFININTEKFLIN